MWILNLFRSCLGCLAIYVCLISLVHRHCEEEASVLGKLSFLKHPWAKLVILELLCIPFMSCWLGPSELLRKTILLKLVWRYERNGRVSSAYVLVFFEFSDMSCMCLPLVGSIFIVSNGVDSLENIGEVSNSESFSQLFELPCILCTYD